ncbi:MAG: ACT domain-containing protein [Ruminococcus sp.]|jgi:hypothetical protein|nr:ACT domain-containing protein [Ruminococcus sp.]
MLIKQLSVFVENKKGRLSAILNILRDNKIDIRALSVADTRDFGILRLIVDDPEKAYEELHKAACLVNLTSVIAVGITDRPGGLADAMDCLSAEGISVEYMYAFISKTDDCASVILRVPDKDNEKAVDVLSKDFKILSSNEII